MCETFFILTTGVLLVYIMGRAKDGAVYPTMHRMPKAKIHPVQNIINVEVKKH